MKKKKKKSTRKLQSIRFEIGIRLRIRSTKMDSVSLFHGTCIICTVGEQVHASAPISAIDRLRGTLPEIKDETSPSYQPAYPISSSCRPPGWTILSRAAATASLRNELSSSTSSSSSSSSSWRTVTWDRARVHLVHSSSVTERHLNEISRVRRWFNETSWMNCPIENFIRSRNNKISTDGLRDGVWKRE